MNNKLILCGLGAMLFAVSCQERFSDKTEDGSMTTVKAGIVQTVSKTWLDMESAQTPVPVYWSDGDQINVNGQNSSSLDVPEGQKVSSAEFLMRSVAVPYNTIYPASIVTGTLYDAEGYIDVTIPSTQQYTPNSFANGSAILYGYSASAEASVSMHNACSAIMVELKGTAADEIISASVTSNSSLSPISGEFKLRPQDGELIAVAGKSELSLSDVDVVLSANVSRFFFTVPAGLYEDGFSLTFKRKSDRRAMQCKWTPTDTLRAGHLYRFADVTFAPGAKSIENAEDWNEFATALNEGGDISKLFPALSGKEDLSMGEDKKADKKRKRIVPKAPVQMIISREYVGTQTVTEAFVPIISEDIRKKIAEGDTFDNEGLSA